MKIPVRILSAAVLGVLWMSSAARSAEELEGSEWQIAEMVGKPVKMPQGKKPPTLKLDAEKKQAAGYAGCNSYFSAYTLEGQKLKFGPAGSTRRACPEEQTAVEQEWFKVMAAVRGFKVQEDSADLLSENGKVLARLTRQKKLA